MLLDLVFRRRQRAVKRLQTEIAAIREFERFDSGTRIHVDKEVITRNRVNGGTEAPIQIDHHGTTIRAHAVALRGPSYVIHDIGECSVYMTLAPGTDIEVLSGDSAPAPRPWELG